MDVIVGCRNQNNNSFWSPRVFPQMSSRETLREVSDEALSGGDRDEACVQNNQKAHSKTHLSWMLSGRLQGIEFSFPE